MTTNLPATRTVNLPVPAKRPRPARSAPPRPPGRWALPGKLAVCTAIPAAISVVSADTTGRLLLWTLTGGFGAWAAVETARRLSRMSRRSAISPISPQVRPPMRALEAAPPPAPRRR